MEAVARCHWGLRGDVDEELCRTGVVGWKLSPRGSSGLWTTYTGLGTLHTWGCFFFNNRVALSCVTLKQLFVQTMAGERGHVWLWRWLSKEPPSQPNPIQECRNLGANARRAAETPLQRLPAHHPVPPCREGPLGRKRRPGLTWEPVLSLGV